MNRPIDTPPDPQVSRGFIVERPTTHQFNETVLPELFIGPRGKKIDAIPTKVSKRLMSTTTTTTPSRRNAPDFLPRSPLHDFLRQQIDRSQLIVLAPHLPSTSGQLVKLGELIERGEVLGYGGVRLGYCAIQLRLLTLFLESLISWRCRDCRGDRLLLLILPHGEYSFYGKG